MQRMAEAVAGPGRRPLQKGSRLSRRGQDSQSQGPCGEGAPSSRLLPSDHGSYPCRADEKTEALRAAAGAVLCRGGVSRAKEDPGAPCLPLGVQRVGVQGGVGPGSWLRPVLAHGMVAGIWVMDVEPDKLGPSVHHEARALLVPLSPSPPVPQRSSPRRPPC